MSQSESAYSVSFIRPNVLHIIADTQYDATAMMIRISEFYESSLPSIRYNLFTLDEVQDAYASLNNNEMTYYEDWTGFNIPGDVVMSFYRSYSQSSFTELSRRELLLHQMLRQHCPQMVSVDAAQYYLIVTCRGCESALNHELAHAYWYMNSEYRDKMTAMMTACRQPLTAIGEQLFLLEMNLSEMGYSHDVLEDELQAYMSTSSFRYMCRELDWPNTAAGRELYDNFCKPFHALFKELVRTGDPR